MNYYYVAYAVQTPSQNSFRRASLAWDREINSAQEVDRVEEFLRKDNGLPNAFILSWQPIEPFDPAPEPAALADTARKEQP